MSLKSLSKGMMHPIVSESHKLMTLRGLRQSRRRRCIWSQILLGSWFVVYDGICGSKLLPDQSETQAKTDMHYDK